MKRTVTPRLSRRLSSACRTWLVKASEMGVFSFSYRSGATSFLTRVRGVWPSRYRILQTFSVRQTPVEPFGRAATAPEDFRLNGQHIAVFLRIPRFGQLPLKPFQAPLDECLIFCIGDVGET